MTEVMSKHLGDEWLSAYAAGHLSFGHEIVIASHLELNPEARKAYQTIEAVGGALLEGLAETPVSKDILNGLLEGLSEEGSTSPSPKRANHPDYLPKTLAGYFDQENIRIKWKTLGPGIKRFPIIKGKNGESVWLLKAKPGSPIPEHGHRGSEITLVLTGRLLDGDAEFARGDVEDVDESVLHQPVVGEGEDCICLVFNEAPLKFKSFFARALQPFLGL